MKGVFSNVLFCTDEKEKLYRFFEDKVDTSYGNGGAERRYPHKTQWKIKEAFRTCVKRQPASYKTLPEKLTPSYARGFIAGLMATDGCVPEKGSFILTCEGMEQAKKIAEIATLGGCVVTSIKVGSTVSPYTGKEREHCRILMKPFSVPLIREDQIKRRDSRNIKQNYHMYLDVVGIEYTGNYEEVFCVVAPETYSFTLSTGILTGNCFVLDNNLDSKQGWGNLSKEMIVTSMTGGGCGIDFSEVRPNGAGITGQRGVAPGPLGLMKLINNNGHPVKAGGS
jgi:hypothetical protein